MLQTQHCTVDLYRYIDLIKVILRVRSDLPIVIFVFASFLRLMH